MKQVISYLAVPALLIVAGMAGYFAIHLQWNYEMTALGIFLGTAFFILLLERWIPLKNKWGIRKKELKPDLWHTFISTAMFDAIGKTAALSLILYLQKTGIAFSSPFENTSLLVNFITANIIGEFLPYVYHRVSHQGKEDSVISLFLWKIHAIHHLPGKLNWFKTNWIHPINMFLNTFLKVAPLLILGFSQEIIFLVGITHVVVAYISHANIDTKTGWLDYIIVTPQVHHFHHSKKMEEAKNYGNILPIWDLLFGTYYNRSGSVKKVGVVKSFFNYPDQLNYWEHLLFPIKSFRECCPNDSKKH
ncbi:MAG: hypothetical protein GVY07_15640 [Bacteroidetes bacterium]|jgi:sterol desaturase/sphingolipid hydroxylase (fatty acid hydroxylase superfamily)|nr:hypothetical protein [Bacteroidota bacterium]